MQHFIRSNANDGKFVDKQHRALVQMPEDITDSVEGLSWNILRKPSLNSLTASLPLWKSQNNLGKTDFWFRGVTLIELLVVIAIIAILAALVAPAVQRSITSANFAKATGNMRSLAGAVNLYTSEFQGEFPRMRGDDWRWENLWVTKVAPYLGISGTPTTSKDKVFLNPLETIHGTLSDFGCNSYIFAQDKDTNIAPTVKVFQVKQPSKTVLLSMASERRGTGFGGTWYMESQTFVEMGTNSPSAKPSDLNLGRIAFVNIDGSSSILPWQEFVERREELLNREIAR